MLSWLKTPTIVAPRSDSRRASASTRCLRVSIGTARPPLTWTSRWSRFLMVLRSGTTWNQMSRPAAIRIDDAVRADSQVGLRDANVTPVVIPAGEAGWGWLKLISQSGNPEAGQQVRIGAVDDQLESNSHRALPSVGRLSPTSTNRLRARPPWTRGSSQRLGASTAAVDRELHGCWVACAGHGRVRRCARPVRMWSRPCRNARSKRSSACGSSASTIIRLRCG
jgi:hypothetical protein